MVQDVKRGVWLPFEPDNYFVGELILCVSTKETLLGMVVPVLAVATNRGYCEIVPGGEKMIPTHILNIPNIPQQ